MDKLPATPTRAQSIAGTVIGMAVVAAFVYGAGTLVAGIFRSSVPWYFWACGLCVVVAAAVVKGALQRAARRW
jgi:bacteriorhodopsin